MNSDIQFSICILLICLGVSCCTYVDKLPDQSKPCPEAQP